MALIKPDDGHDHGIKFNNEEDAARLALEEPFKLARLGDPSAQYAAAFAILHVEVANPEGKVLYSNVELFKFRQRLPQSNKTA